jgi:hypothetical protein
MSDTQGALDGVHGFDFLYGGWDVAHRRLRERLVGSEDWELFAGTAVCIPLFRGAANIDVFEFPTLG